MALGLVELDLPSQFDRRLGLPLAERRLARRPAELVTQTEDAGGAPSDRPSGDTRTERSDEPQYQNKADRLAAEAS
ncbi:MAG: hypothetical protein R2710_00685 [Acidimicrobiales bacterium]